jgi:hypothetical protein
MLVLFHEIMNEVCGSHDAGQTCAINNGDRVESAATEDYSGVTDRAGNGHSDYVCSHHILQFSGMVEHCVEAANILIAELTKADSQEISPGEDSDKFTAAKDGQVVDPRFLEYFSGFRERVACFEDNRILSHDL